MARPSKPGGGATGAGVKPDRGAQGAGAVTAALRSENLAVYRGRCWRVVEAQHVVSTASLVGTLDRQKRLEDLIDASKPPVPPACRPLHYLLSAPFRYSPKQGSRFRRAGDPNGVFYTARQVETAVAEMAFHRVLFYAELPATPFPEGFSDYTAFAVAIDTDRLVDLVARPDPAVAQLADYAASQVFAEAARAVDATGIAQVSVRCPRAGTCLSWLTSSVFAKPSPVAFASWKMRLNAEGVQAICEHPRADLEFGPETFGADPRIAAFQWGR